MRPDERALDSNPPSFANRRRGRVEVVAAIHGQILPDNVPITLLNVSHGGFLMRSPVAYAVDDMHTFRFTIPGEPAPDRPARPRRTSDASDDEWHGRIRDRRAVHRSASHSLPASDSTPGRHGFASVTGRRTSSFDLILP
jgi:hypothetical protein